MSTAAAFMPASPFATTTTAAGGDYEQCRKGNLAAVIFGLIDLGTHTITYPAKDGKPARDVRTRKGMLLIQISTRLRKQANGEPFVFGVEFSMGSSPAAKMRQMYETVMGVSLPEGVQFDPIKLVGKSCTANIVDAKTSKGKDFAKLDGVTALAEGMEEVEVAIPGLPHQTEEGKPALFWFHNAGMGDFPTHNWLPWSYGQKLFDVYKESHEYVAVHGGPAAGADVIPQAAPVNLDGEDIPF